MRFAIAQPCLGSWAIVLNINRSKVPWIISFGLLTCTSVIYINTSVIDNQGALAARFGEMKAALGD
jgi:hypothetical protein